jgi:S-(hydroxymethyl)glutathione dehydrogenase/alcohol dehydrogenase
MGQVLVKVVFSGVCRSQLMEVQGARGEDKWLPHLLGHEGSGIVVDIGPGVTKVKKGDEVILGWIKGNGIDAPGVQYKLGDIKVNAGPIATFCNYAVISENRLTLKPPELAFDTAVLFGCALVTGAGMVTNQIKPKVSQSVVVVGLGGVGMSALLALVASGVENLIAIDIDEGKLDFAAANGVKKVFKYQNSVLLKNEIYKETNGGADYCVESAGTVKSIEFGLSIINAQGHLLFASHPPANETISINPHELICGKEITGSWGGAVMPDIDIPKLFMMFKKSNIDINKMLSKVYELTEINEALSDLRNGKVLRPLIRMNH